MASNVLLCRWVEGWHEVRRQSSIDAIGRREAYLSLGAIQELAEVERVADMQLDVVANPRTAIAADLAPIDHSDSPYWSFNVGDTIGVPDYGTGTISQRVRVITGAEDDNGEITYSPELGDLILEEQERTLQTIKKMADGTLDGDSAVAQPPLRNIIARMWTTPASPGQVGGFTAESTYNRGNGSSAYLVTPPGGHGTYTLTGVEARPLGDGLGSGSMPVMRAWQVISGGGDVEIGHVNLPISFQSGVTYPGEMYVAQVGFGGTADGDGYAIYFSAEGTFGSDVAISAMFNGGGTVVPVSWMTS